MSENKIFICDDDVAIAEMLEIILEPLGSQIVIETNSVYAFDGMQKHRPDILVVDLWMPIVSGDQLIRNIRNNPELHNIFILCISASRDGSDVALAAGADVFLPKPFDLDNLLDIVENALK